MLSGFHKGLGAVGSTAALLMIFILPAPIAFAAQAHQNALTEPPTKVEELPSQSIVVSSSDKIEPLARDSYTVTSRAEIIAAAGPQVYKDIPSGSGAEGLVNAALAQLGTAQDCTDLVQNSLAAIGLIQRRDQGGLDLGTGIWQYDGFGTRVDISSLNPGDILIYGNAGSGTHVAIYIGDGQAVHGGYNGGTVIAPANSPADILTGAIRV